MMPREKLGALIMKHRDAARAGAYGAHLDERHIEDAVNEAVLRAWRRYGNDDGLPASEREVGYLLRSFLRRTGFNVAQEIRAKNARLDFREDLTREGGASDPWPRLVARDELRVMVRRARLRPQDQDAAEYIEPTRPISAVAVYLRREKLRRARGK